MMSDSFSIAAGSLTVRPLPCASACAKRYSTPRSNSSGLSSALRATAGRRVLLAETVYVLYKRVSFDQASPPHHQKWKLTGVHDRIEMVAAETAQIARFLDRAGELLALS